tara:strand:+ start:34740 stop:36407 length:1668 start_codon:yes stop_codon:yes gene_type:complete
MVLNSGTGITDHIDMLDKLIEVVTSRNLTAVAINAGGTGHAIGDIIQITATGSTSTIVAQLEVISVAAGVIDGIRVYRGGAYTVDPTTIVANPQSATSGTGISATFDLTFSAAVWAVNRRSQQAASAVFGTAGTGYTVGDVLTLVDGTAGVRGDGDAAGTQASAATFTVATISGGGGTGPVATVTLTTAGNYEEAPSNDAATTGGTGTGCELTVTYEDPPQTDSDFQIAMLQGEGLAGADEIHVAIKAYTQASGFDFAFNWGLYGTTGYSSTLPLHQQLGINADQINVSTGALPVSDIGAYLVLKDNDAEPDMGWWIHHNGRRIILVVKVEGASTVQYSSCYMGFINQLATTTEYPYPLLVGAGTNDRNRLWTETTLLSGGIVESIANATGDPLGPLFLKYPDGNWIAHTAEGSSGATSRAVEPEWGVYPFMNPGQIGAPKQIVINTTVVGYAFGTRAIIPVSGVPGTETVLLKPTPGTGDDYYRLVQPVLMRAETNGAPLLYNMHGEIDGVFWFNRGNNAIVSEDRMELGTERYLIFQNGNRTQNWSYFALNED